MLKIMSAPGRYIQGYNVINDFAFHVSKIGNRPFIMGGRTALSRVKEKIIPGIQTNNLDCRFSVFTGKGTIKDATDLAEEASIHQADIIAGIGGGLAIDTAKAVAHNTGLPLVIVPTIASTDAPCSSAALQYTENHVIDNIVLLNRNPACHIFFYRYL